MGWEQSHSEPASSLEPPRFGPRRVPPSSFKANVPASPSKSALPTSPAGADDERWTFKGRADLLDIQVVVPVSRDLEEGARFEILSPDGSFACVAGLWGLAFLLWEGRGRLMGCSERDGEGWVGDGD